VTIRTVHAEPPFDDLVHSFAAPTDGDGELRQAVAEIVRRVAHEGEAALLEYAGRFDGVRVDDVGGLRLSPEAMADAADRLDPELMASLRRAAENIRTFHERQLERGFLDLHEDGTMLGQRVTPLRRVGVYVPGGRAAYPSTVLMCALPARVAGVEEIVMVTPAPDGEVLPVVLAAAHLAGITEAYRVGGAHAVAALAAGTAGIRRVDKIVGPGNRWVAEAKRQVFGWVDIDMVAGPSEILVVADGSAHPAHVAADLIGQAEHDPDAIAWLVTPDAALAKAVPHELERLLATNARAEIAREALARNGLIAVVADLQSAAALAEARAPEHLELLVERPLELAGRIRSAGAIFLGAHSPEPVGDYIAGPNHVLPTGGTARWASPLGTYDFLKRTSLIGYSAARLRREGPDVVRLAESEGLTGHADAVRVRLASPDPTSRAASES
jgi:histidinol dehydrogenase